LAVSALAVWKWQSPPSAKRLYGHNRAVKVEKPGAPQSLREPGFFLNSQ